MADMYSFDIVSDFDKGEMNNVVDQSAREIANRYDFKGTSASIDWIDSDKSGLKICGDNQFHLDAIIDIVRKKAASRGLSQKIFDVSLEPSQANFTMTWKVPFVKGLSSDKAKKITNMLRDQLPKVKTQIQGEAVRVSSPKKDQLQQAMSIIKNADYDFPIEYNNYR